ncbi:hypothetical protein N7486_001483 [Penicillium sp. IBT 16267x]|nr:hypothetical protein N7486_001483 [Penicillium sp. IBT 16267x]
MDQLPTPFSPIQTTRPPTSDTSSPPSSRTTSPPSSPTSTFRHRARTTSRSLTSPHHLFNLSFQPHPHHSSPQSQDNHSNPSTCNEHPHTVSILPCAVLRGRSSLMVVRRRPSAVDMALIEERSRCDCDAIERAGLGLMEPRPVEMEREARMAMNMDMNMDMNANIATASHGNGGNSTTSNEDRCESLLRPQQSPRFVMGGIFEVMEGRA